MVVRLRLFALPPHSCALWEFKICPGNLEEERKDPKSLLLFSELSLRAAL